METSPKALTQPHQILIVSEDACQKVIGRREAFQAVMRRWSIPTDRCC